MNQHARTAMVVTGAAGIFAMLLWGFWSLPPFGNYPGPYGNILNKVAVHERQITNVVTAVNYDYRGLDTMGEEFIMVAAVAGLALLLRRERHETLESPLAPSRGRTNQPRSDAIRAFGIVGFALTVLFGVYVVLHGPLTPGGGFQGGAVTGSAFALLYLGAGYRAFSRATPQTAIDFFEALGAGSYVAVGIAALAAGGAFLKNVLPLGHAGAFFSSGTIELINFFVGVEIWAGFLLMFVEFGRETRIELEGDATAR